MDVKVENWAVPNPIKVNEIINKNVLELIESITYLSELATYTNVNVSDFLKNKFNHIANSTSYFFIIHESLLKAANEKDREKCHKILDIMIYRLEFTNKYTGNNPIILPYIKAFPDYLIGLSTDVFKNATKESYDNKYRGKELVIDSPSNSSFKITEEVIYSTLEKLRDVDIIHYHELCRLIDKIVIIESNGTNASSYLHSLGLIMIRSFDRGTEHWSRMLEHCVHESAHNLLYHIWYQQPVITDDDGVYSTPFRLDLRPLSAVYHAMFVLCRTILAFDVFISHGLLNNSDIKSHYNEANNSIPFKEKFNQTASVLIDSNKMTIFGEKLLRDCISAVNCTKNSI